MFRKNVHNQCGFSSPLTLLGRMSPFRSYSPGPVKCFQNYSLPLSLREICEQENTPLQNIRRLAESITPASSCSAAVRACARTSIHYFSYTVYVGGKLSLSVVFYSQPGLFLNSSYDLRLTFGSVAEPEPPFFGSNC